MRLLSGFNKDGLFAKKGIQKKDMDRHMELADAVRALRFIVDTPDGLVVPELGIKPAFY